MLISLDDLTFLDTYRQIVRTDLAQRRLRSHIAFTNFDITHDWQEFRDSFRRNTHYVRPFQKDDNRPWHNDYVELLRDMNLPPKRTYKPLARMFELSTGPECTELMWQLYVHYCKLWLIGWSDEDWITRKAYELWAEDQIKPYFTHRAHHRWFSSRMRKGAIHYYWVCKRAYHRHLEKTMPPEVNVPHRWGY